MSRSLMHALCTFTLLSIVACGGGRGEGDGPTRDTDDATPPTGMDGGGDPPALPDCGATCENKASSCGAPEDQISAGCEALCSSTATEEQLDCLETTPCMALFDSFARDEAVCGIGMMEQTDAGMPETDGGGGGGDSECLPLDEEDCAPTSGPFSCCDGLSCFSEVIDGENVPRCCVPDGGECDRPEDCCGFTPDANPLLAPDCVGGRCMR